MNFKLKVQKVIQPIGEFYIGKIDAKDLYRMAKADILKISNNSSNILYDGIQRTINESKVKSIEDYLTSYDASFPNSIILNINYDKVLSIDEDELIVVSSEDTFQIIDGQHRLEGFRKMFNIRFDLVVSIFIGLSEKEQARIFTTINSEQTKVNPSIEVYHHANDDFYTPRKVAANIAILFGTEIGSPWRNAIKILGTKDEYSENGIISLRAFTKPIIDMIYDDKDYNKIRNELATKKGTSVKSALRDFHYDKILWEMYTNEEDQSIYKILSNYFTAISNVLRKDWGNEKSLLTKTTGYNALMILFIDLFKEGLDKGDLTLDYFKNKVIGLKNLSGMINSANYGASGEKASKVLYEDMSRYINFKRKI